MIENCADNLERPGFPICLAEDVTIMRNIAKDDKILMEDIEYDSQQYRFKLYSMALEQSDVANK